MEKSSVGMPFSSDFKVTVSGKPVSVYGMPTRYGEPMCFACADITIRNVSVGHQKGGPRSEFTGHAPDKRVERVLIEGLRYGGKLVTDAAGMGLRTNAHVADIRFAAGKEQQP
ncbi:MAG: hypothetical protein FJ290_22710 [Planctomycetes bacterium]|nr:hypothetical protein [Planctomycetota bacterium]